jgi:hypothetical protein
MRFVLLACGVLLLVGCARDEAAFPSLSPRGAEGRNFAEPAVAPPSAPVPDPELDARIAGWSRQLDTIATGFDRDAAQAAAAAAASGARSVGSEAWLTAQSALAALDDWRGQASGLAAEVDDAARERAAAVGTPYPTLEALQERAEREVARIADSAAAIAASLPTP